MTKNDFILNARITSIQKDVYAIWDYLTDYFPPMTQLQEDKVKVFNQRKSDTLQKKKAAELKRQTI